LGLLRMIARIGPRLIEIKSSDAADSRMPARRPPPRDRPPDESQAQGHPDFDVDQELRPGFELHDTIGKELTTSGYLFRFCLA
jgi:hypothetical protein